nr:hypothetical protein DBT41_10955 [Aerococcus urinae]
MEAEGGPLALLSILPDRIGRRSMPIGLADQAYMAKFELRFVQKMHQNNAKIFSKLVMLPDSRDV